MRGAARGNCNTNSYGCFDSPWDGGFCFLPRFKEAYVRLNQDGQDNAWFSVMSQEFGQWHGEFASYRKCDVYLYRTSIEANQFYQAASATQRNRYLKNLWDHEFSHCSGLAHTQGTLNTLMSVDYTYPGPYFDNNLSPTQAEDNMLTAFDPIN